jgi:catechol 2,3-dioxygenase-like lactoylglutathione lyase family enzyme
VDIDHLTVSVTDYERSKHFYADVLEPLGFVVLMDWHDKRRAYLGVPPAPSSLWLVESPIVGTLDISFPAADPETVETFHRCALAAGARIVDAPGIRANRNRAYYACRILDPDGNSVEVVHRAAGVVAA